MVVFKSVAPSSSTKLSGSFEISGLIQAVKTGIQGVYESQLIDQRWQIQLSLNNASDVLLFFLAKHRPGEALDKDGERKGHYEVSVEMTLGNLTWCYTEPLRRYRPTQYALPAIGWSTNWFSKSVVFDFLDRDPCEDMALINYTIIEQSDAIPPTRAITSFPNVAASLFDDEETSNVVFAISDPRHSTRHDDYIYAHTKILASRADYFKTMFSSPFKEVLRVTSIHELDLGVKDFGDTSESDLEDESLTDGTLTVEDSLKDVTSTLKRRVVRVTDASYATYRAMIYYLYTGLWSFAPLTSTSQPHRTSSDLSESLNDCNVSEPDPIGIITPEDVPCSNAKSIYKLCDRLQIPELKAAALDHIRCSLTPENITTEICSSFTSRYSEVREIQKGYLRAHWAETKFSKTFSKLICKSFGDQPDGVAEVWLEFFKQL